MITPTSESFADFFQALDGHTPFPWQKELAAKVAAGDWPSLIKLPTASGKTACLDIAVFALACQARRPAAERTAPRRIAFVVDRRVIVDEAFKRAEKITKALKETENGILREVAEALLELSGTNVPLQCFQLRGGMYRDDEWARIPTQPTILTSTVDQIGSRLLFRSYGFVKRLTFPIHAGLAAYDMLIILDEAHCAQPFQQTADAIKGYRDWANVTLPGPFRFVTMTATPPEGKEPFKLGEEDYKNETLSDRLTASKPITLAPPVGNAKDDDDGLHKALVEALVKHAEDLANKPGLRAIGVMVNRVATARDVHDKLKEKHGDNALLLIGRMRPFDRDRVQKDRRFEQLLADNSKSRQLDAPIFAVATQTLEVGANLDFDALVSECASLDALRQRFGRLNRMGRKDLQAEGVIVIRADDANIEERKGQPDPVYGETMAKTWHWLQGEWPIVADSTGTGKRSGKKKSSKSGNKQIDDMGITALEPRLAKLHQEGREAELSQTTLDAPVMLPAHIDAWAQTAPSPVPEPDAAIFLHGPQRGRPEVQLVWRADLPEKSSEEDWINAVTLCPPTSVEALAAPLYLVKQWLRRLKVEAKPKVEERVLSDVEGEDSRSESDKPDARKVCPPILLWRGPKKKKRQGNASGELSDARLESKLTADLDEIKPNDTIILPVKYGGWENFGHVLEPIDVAEAARWKAKREAVLRLHPAVLTALPEGEAKGQLLAMVDGEDKPEANELRAAFVALAEIGPEYFREWLTALSRAEKFSIEEHPLAGWAVTGKLKKEKKHPVEVLSALTDDDDDAASLVAPKGREVTLEEHVSGVTKYAVQFATQCGLPPELISVFELAGKFHDAGKADPRFQRWLYGCMGNMWGARSGKLLAKSTPKNDAIKWQAQAESGYPKGSRHEVLSVSLVQNHEGVKTLAQESKCDWDLILHLVASHHGHCRPFAPVVDDPQPADVKVQLYGYELTGASSTGLERLDSGIAERFWKLTRKYGWWGLAYLEAIFRLADHYQSHLDTGDL